MNLNAYTEDAIVHDTGVATHLDGDVAPDARGDQDGTPATVIVQATKMNGDGEQHHGGRRGPHGHLTEMTAAMGVMTMWLRRIRLVRAAPRRTAVQAATAAMMTMEIARRTVSPIDGNAVDGEDDESDVSGTEDEISSRDERA